MTANSTDPPESSEPVQTSRGRDLRVDLIRGLALFIIIFIDHNRCLIANGGHWLSDYTLGSFSFIDAFDVFILLSGYVSGIVYTRVLLSRGLRPCLEKAFQRCLQLYIAQMSLFLVCFVLVHSVLPGGLNAFSWDVRSFRSDPIDAAIQGITLRNLPPLLDLLPLYMVFIAFTPLALCLWIHRPRTLVLLTLGSYLAIQLVSHFRSGIEASTFNLFAWQLVFVAGLLMGFRKGRNPGLHWCPSRKLLLVSIGGLSLVTLLRLARSRMIARLLHSQVLIYIFSLTVPFSDKATAGPLRLVNLLFWVIVVAAMKPDSRVFRSVPARVASLCGQNSLALYWMGVVLNYVGLKCLGNLAGGMLSKVAFTWLGCGALVGTAFVWTRLMSSRQGSVVPIGLADTLVQNRFLQSEIRGAPSSFQGTCFQQTALQVRPVLDTGEDH